MASHLKNLELQGYKTFANRTLFEFSEAVTAIVGPNGSGKSNIADSIRWVLGEQSYSLLRGRKTEDMIFAGSEQRPRAGMASATIAFDNSDGWLPIDYSEVSITRRAYRDGENEYLINNQRVRLKDVAELLSQTGLAERTYTVIGQGLVDAALALKAEERRHLFEEAAGIGLHRSRREDALRRLDITRRNIDRVEDILAELEPRLRSLERQARRAQEYDQLRADLRVLLRDWYGYHWHLAQEELQESRNIARLQENILDRNRQEQLALDIELTKVRAHILDLRNDLTNWHRQLAQVHSKRETLSRDVAVFDERIRALSKQQQDFRSELIGLQEELFLDKERLALADSEVQRLEIELSETSDRLSDSQRLLTERKVQRLQVEQDLQEVLEQIAGINAQHNQLLARIQERQARHLINSNNLKQLNQTLSQVDQKSKQAIEKLQISEDSLGQAETDLLEAERSFLDINQRIGEAELERRKLNEERDEIDIERAKLITQRNVLDQAENTLTGYGEGTRILLRALHQARLEGGRGVLSQEIQVPEDIETAIAVALGEYLEAIILLNDPSNALDMLRNQPGRAVILPLSSLKSCPALPHLDLGGSPDVLGVASELVKAPAELQTTLELLLGQVWIVRNRSAAQIVLSAYKAYLQDQNRTDLDKTSLSPAYPRAVTLDGEVFLASGPVIAGKIAGESPSQTVLSRARQRRELNAHVQQIDESIHTLDKRIEEADRYLQNLRIEGAESHRLQQQMRQAFEGARLAHNQAQLEYEQIQRNYNWQLEQINRLQSDILQAEQEIERLNGQVGEFVSALERLRSSQQTHSVRLADLSLEEYQSQYTYWNTLLGTVRKALENSQAHRNNQALILERLINRAEVLTTRDKEIEETISAIEIEKSKSRQSESEIGAMIDSVNALIEPAETELDQYENRQVDLQNSEAAARQSLNLAEHNHAQSRIALVSRQEALENLRHRIEDDFGLVAFEYAEHISGPTPLPLDGLVEALPRVFELSPEIEDGIKRCRAQMRRLGPVNPEAQAEYMQVKERYSFLIAQLADLNHAEMDVRQIISELDTLMQQEFHRTFKQVATEFKGIFERLFGGGSARLILTDPEDMTSTGIEIEARLPGRREQGLSLLSGGERSLTAAALIFSLLKVSPTPFCILDEVDAMLDEANVGRFRDLLSELSQATQFIIVTHNRNTVQAADVIYGVTMGRDSVSQVVSLKLDEITHVID